MTGERLSRQALAISPVEAERHDDGVDTTVGRAISAAASVTAHQVRTALKRRRLRDVMIDDELFFEPAWDMLLELYAADLDGCVMCITSLQFAASLPLATALRWIGKLEQEGLIVRRPDSSDRRRTFIELSKLGRQRMDHYWSQAIEA